MNTLRMEGSPTAWHLAMATLQATEIYEPAVDVPLFECTSCDRSLSLEKFKCKANGRRLRAICLDCTEAKTAKAVAVFHRMGRKVDSSSITYQAKLAGMAQSTVMSRMRRGMTLEQALTSPFIKQRETSKWKR